MYHKICNSCMIFLLTFTMNQFFFCFFLLYIFIFTSCIYAQQNYSENSTLGCHNNHDSVPSSTILYNCNGQNRSCRAFLIYKSQPPFNSVPSISALTSSNQAELASINNVTENAKFPTGKEVIVPVNCSCFGQYYQANTKFEISSIHGTYYTIATEAFQELSTCNALKRANPYSEYRLIPGIELKVPLRCACPTNNQIRSGTNYLLTYSFSLYDNVPDLSHRFNVSRKRIMDANCLEEKQTIFPSTTILIPLPNFPVTSQTIIHKDQPLDLPSYEEYPKTNKSKRKHFELVGIAVASSFLVLIIIILFVVFMFNKRKVGVGVGVLHSGHERNMNYGLPEDIRVEIASFDQGLRVFTFGEIKKATKNFSSNNRIKGSVYLGNFGGKILAVRKMKLDHVSMEVQLLKNINHFNLIKLQGVCENNGAFYLVYEHMKNGSLKDWLFNQTSNEIGSWTRRIQIALDVANGLHYLHNFTKPSYIHGDIKSSNVLLNSDLRAKIANFSLARAVVIETSSISSTSHAVESRPEYEKTGQVTSKIDVYAFGVLLLELITGKDAIIMQDGRELLLSKAVVLNMEKENVEAELDSYIDPRLKSDDRGEIALRMAQLSLACLTDEPKERPSMEDIISVLSKIQAKVLE